MLSSKGVMNMKKTMIVLVTALCLACGLCALTGCGTTTSQKSDDASSSSSATQEQSSTTDSSLVGTWHVSKVTAAGVTVEGDQVQQAYGNNVFTLEFTQDGKMTVTASASSTSISGTYPYQLESDGTLSFPGNSVVQSTYPLKFANGELTMDYELNNNTYGYTFSKD